MYFKASPTSSTSSSNAVVTVLPPSQQMHYFSCNTNVIWICKHSMWYQCPLVVWYQWSVFTVSSNFLQFSVILTEKHILSRWVVWFQAFFETLTIQHWYLAMDQLSMSFLSPSLSPFAYVNSDESIYSLDLWTYTREFYSTSLSLHILL